MVHALLYLGRAGAKRQLDSRCVSGALHAIARLGTVKPSYDTDIFDCAAEVPVFMLAYRLLRIASLGKLVQ